MLLLIFVALMGASDGLLCSDGCADEHSSEIPTGACVWCAGSATPDPIFAIHGSSTAVLRGAPLVPGAPHIGWTQDIERPPRG